MFVQSAKFVENHSGNINDISIYGQDSNPTTWKLAQMNLAIRGIEPDLGKYAADTFLDDQHPTMRADYIMAIILTPILMSILSSENAQRFNQSKTYFTLDLLIGWHSTLLRVSRP